MNVRFARLTTTALGAACGFLLLTVLLQYAGIGRGYGWLADDPASAPSLPGGAINDKPIKLPPESAFADVDAHPLFNEDRKPTPAEASDSDANAPISPLNIALTGIVSTSSVKIAMVQDKARNQSMALKVGMPLEGDQASWTLVEVKPRSVVFRSAANERSEIELETAVTAPPKAAAPSHNTKQATAANARNTTVSGTTTVKDNKRGDTGDLAKRIEDRRRQMREDAQKMRKPGDNKGKPPNPPPPPPKQ